VGARAAGGEPDAIRTGRWPGVYTEFLTGLHRSPTPELFAAQRGWHEEAAFLGAVRNSWESMTVRSRLLTPVGGGLAIRSGLTEPGRVHRADDLPHLRPPLSAGTVASARQPLLPSHVGQHQA
jgi:hypothetical protein